MKSLYANQTRDSGLAPLPAFVKEDTQPIAEIPIQKIAQMPIQKMDIQIRKMERPIQKMEIWLIIIPLQRLFPSPYLFVFLKASNIKRYYSHYDFVRFLLSDRIYLWALALDRAHLYRCPYRPGGPSACVVLYWPIIIILYMIIIYWLIIIILYSHHSIWSSYIGQA